MIGRACSTHDRHDRYIYKLSPEFSRADNERNFRGVVMPCSSGKTRCYRGSRDLQQISVCRLLLATSVLVLLFDPEYRGDMFLRNMGFSGQYYFIHTA